VGPVTPELVRRVTPDLFGYAIRLTGGDRARAEDLVQETLLALVRHPDGPTAQVTTGWLMVVLRRRFLDSVRSQRREDRRVLRAVRLDGSVEPDWSAVEGGAALQALGRLSDLRRVALILRYVDDLPVQEVAQLLGRTPSATESLLARARRELARVVRGESDG